VVTLERNRAITQLAHAKPFELRGVSVVAHRFARQDRRADRAHHFVMRWDMQRNFQRFFKRTDHPFVERDATLKRNQLADFLA
jgi:hypothetical protein